MAKIQDPERGSNFWQECGWNNRNSHSLLKGIQMVQSSWKTGRQFGHFLQNWTNCYLITQQLWSFVFIKEGESSCPHKTLHTNIYSSFIHNCQNLEATKTSLISWMDKSIYPDNIMLFSTKKKWSFKPWKDMKKKIHISNWHLSI
jgi:hypothetical protein